MLLVLLAKSVAHRKIDHFNIFDLLETPLLGRTSASLVSMRRCVQSLLPFWREIKYKPPSGKNVPSPFKTFNVHITQKALLLIAILAGLTVIWSASSVADPDKGSGAFLPLDLGSGMGKKIRIRIRDEQPGSYSERLETIFGVIILKFLMGSGTRDGKNWDPG